jgi:CspA family cold shock protein
VLDQPPTGDPGEKEGSPRRRGDTDSIPNHPKKLLPGAASEGKELPKRKAAVVNRKGPSEIDRALRMNQTLNGRSGSSDRKVTEGSVARGTVVRIDRTKGFGFLMDSAGEQRFFHRSAVLDGGFSSLREHQTVEFEARGDERGARAIKVRPVEGPAPAAKAPQRSQPSSKTPKSGGWRSDLMPFRNGTTPPPARRKRF